jgi:diguanylate cyclase (GGDEF)-like protein
MHKEFLIFPAFNRRSMDETQHPELSRANRRSLALSLIVLDVDHFKKVNDMFAWAAGNLF